MDFKNDKIDDKLNYKCQKFNVNDFIRNFQSQNGLQKYGFR